MLPEQFKIHKAEQSLNSLLSLHPELAAKMSGRKKTPLLPARKSYVLIKRILDLLLATLILIPVLPVMAVCALLIRMEDRGPILIAQPRTGKRGRRFRMYKFRTMVPNAEKLKEKYRHLNELTWPDFKITNDPRVTPIGRILRKTSLDELPQLLNVLKGEMSLVGPRPTSFEATTYQLWQTERLEVLPGITGFWQINGRCKIDFEQRSRMDIDYVEKQSVQSDMLTLLKTIPAVIRRNGAC